MTMTQANDQVMSILDTLRNLSTQVKTIDAELGTDVSGPIAARNKLANEYVARYNTPQIVTAEDGTQRDNNAFTRFITSVIKNIQDHFTESPEMQIAVYTELGNQMTKTFGDTVKNHLQKVVDSQPKQDAPTISDARKAELATERSNIVNLFKLQKEMLKYLSATPVELPSDIEEPVAKRGSVGPRGAQFTKTYQYYINGKLQELTDSDGVKSNSTLSNLVLSKWAKDLNWKTKDLRDYIVAQNNVTPDKENNVDLPDSWSVTLPAPHADKTLSATVVAASAATVNETPDGDEDEANGTEPESGAEDMFASA